MDDAASRKRALRRRVRASRLGITGEQQAAAAAGLLATALPGDDAAHAPHAAHPAAAALRAATVVAAYVALPGEPDLGPLRQALRRRGTTVLLPVAEPGGRLSWGLDDGRLRPVRPHPGGPLIEQPVTPAGPGALRTADVVLVPATAVDLTGARLGQGGGYYDRALDDRAGPGARRPSVLVAVVHDDEVLPAGAVPTLSHDLRVDAVLTPTRWVEVTR